MVEIVVMLSIVTAISAVVLFSFAGLNEGAALNRSSRELALGIRKAQNMAIAVTEIPVGVVDPTNEVPLAVGIKFSLNDPTHYFLFAERSPLNFKYDGDPEKIVGQDSFLERGVKFNRLIGENGQLHSTIHIIFAAPEADIVLTDINGNPIPGDVITLELISPSGQVKKSVTVRTSGQVSIK